MKNNKILYTVGLFCFTLGLNANTLTISKAYELSLENANEIKSSAYQLESSKENINQVKSKLYPQIDFSLSHSKTDFEINHLHTRSDYEEKETTTDYTVSLKQEIYNKDIFSKVDIEKTRVKLSEIKLELQKQELSKTVFKTYLEILKSKNKIELYESYAKYNRYKLEAVKKKYEMNLSNKMDLLQMQVEYNSSKIDLSKEKKLIDVYKLKLKQLIGDNKFNLPYMNFNKINLSKIKQMKSTVLKHNDFASNLQIQQALLGLTLSKQEIENALSGHHPRISFNARYTKYNSDDITTDYENMKKILVQLEIPIYQGGYTSSRVTSSKLINKAAWEDLLKVKKDIKIQYDELIILFDTSITSLNLYKETLQSAQLYYDSVSLGFENGLKSIVDLHDAQNKVYDVKYKYIQNIYDIVDAYVGLLIVTNNFKSLKLVDDIIN